MHTNFVSGMFKDLGKKIISGADKSLARTGRKQDNISLRVA